LHDSPSGRAAGDALTSVYRAADRFVGDIIAATEPSSVIVFSMGGMGPNRSDAASMVLLPELMLRWSLGERRLVVPEEWTRQPGIAPVGDTDATTWSRAWFPGAPAPVEPPSSLPAAARRLGALLAPSVRRRIQRARTQRRLRTLPVGYRDIDWMPAAWYVDRWPEMRAFAVPSFYDGRVRINLRGREAAGIVDVADYDRTCDEIEQCVRDCIDPSTGRSVVESVDRSAGNDPFALGNSLADIVFVWAGCPLAFEHRQLGIIGPVPYRRTGGHTSPYGFASLTGPDVIAGDYGVTSALDVAPTVFELVTGRRHDRLSGQSLVSALSGASTAAR
jgi:hypothetical protein